MAERILANDHGDLLEIYIKTIPQDRLYFFDDGTTISVGMMIILVKIAKKCSKHVTCIGIQPESYEGGKCLNHFKKSWEVIAELSDESHIFDFTSADISTSNTVDEHRALRWNVALQQLADIESGLDVYDYFSRPHQNDWTPRSLEWIPDNS